MAESIGPAFNTILAKLDTSLPAFIVLAHVGKSMVCIRGLVIPSVAYLVGV